jgi:3-oxoacyl-[acyl-carrier-protein] synthase II
MADAMLTGGTGTRLSLVSLMFSGGGELSTRTGDPQHASRPFDEDRDGVIYGEGSAVYVIEAREHAEARGAKILARLAGWSGAWEDRRWGRPGSGGGFASAIELALRKAELTSADIGHVNAHGESTIATDAREAQAIRAQLGDAPVLAMKSYFGNLGAGGGSVELLASLMALETGEIPVTLNYETPDPACPVNVVHSQPQPSGPPAFIKLNQSRTGQTAAVVIAAP